MLEYLFAYLFSLFVAAHAYARNAIIFFRLYFSFLKRRPRRSPNRTQPNIAKNCGSDALKRGPRSSTAYFWWLRRYNREYLRNGTRYRRTENIC